MLGAALSPAAPEATWCTLPLQVTDQNGVKLGNASSLVTAFPAPSDGLSTNIPIIGPPLNPCLFSTCLPRFYAVRRARATRSTNQGIQISVKPRGNYTLAFKTNDGGHAGIRMCIACVWVCGW